LRLIKKSSKNILIVYTMYVSLHPKTNYMQTVETTTSSQTIAKPLVIGSASRQTIKFWADL